MIFSPPALGVVCSNPGDAHGRFREHLHGFCAIKTVALFLLGYSEAAGLSRGSHPKLAADLGSQPGMPPKESQSGDSSVGC